jgi:lipoyl(octanoyl) transferase
VQVRTLGCAEYEQTCARMRAFTVARTAQTPDEVWFVEHPPVFTLGLAGSRVHLLDPGDIPVVHADRGGQVTYHGPGQLVAYTLFDLRRLGLGPRELVRRLEQAVIDTLGGWQLEATRRAGAPGVFVADAKIASLGLRVRQACSYHGLALNISLDLAPFLRINPCGYAGLPMTSLHALGVPVSLAQAQVALSAQLARQFGDGEA